MGPDKEISAMQEVVSALTELKEDEQARVLRWAADRFGITLGPQPSSGKAFAADASNASETREREFEDFASLFNRMTPKGGPEKALSAAYWHQVCLGQDTFEAMQINTALKHLGHRLPNVTDALSSLITRKPSLVLQVRKSGKSKQARKKYKLTTVGIEQVESMLSYSENGQ